MGDLISRLQGDRVTLWRPDVKKQHGTRAASDQEPVLSERGAASGASPARPRRGGPGSNPAPSRSSAASGLCPWLWESPGTAHLALALPAGRSRGLRHPARPSRPGPASSWCLWCPCTLLTATSTLLPISRPIQPREARRGRMSLVLLQGAPALWVPGARAAPASPWGQSPHGSGSSIPNFSV